jgi:nucleotide-binding universal stress UspA family protein
VFSYAICKPNGAAVVSTSKISTIFHPSDFSAASEVAFAHALRIALATGASLNMLHAEPDRLVSWHEFPAVRGTLERWGLIPPNSPKRAVVDLGIDVVKVVAASGRTIPACLKFLKQRPADLIVLAVHQREGRTLWFNTRTGEPLARRAGEVTLFIPDGMSGFVSLTDGSLSLNRVLIPIAHSPSPQPAIDALVRLVDGLGVASGHVTLLHVGSEAKLPKISVPTASRWKWQVKVEEGDAAETIVNAATSERADLIVMTTEGAHGFLDALRGSTSERVLSKTPCPLACLPARALAMRAAKTARIEKAGLAHSTA